MEFTKRKIRYGRSKDKKIGEKNKKI